ncbi:MAG: hypothetical protein LBD20_02600 [Spirochaetaceae bacterium]|jgi:outer membrane lipoprotein SlyB|nr:hypothetical protein [Spirochaetaceae bacterium]
MEKEVTVVVKNSTIYCANKKINDGEEYTCSESEAARLVKLGAAEIKKGRPTKPEGDKAEGKPPESPKPEGDKVK